ncbi:MAG TPA: TOBE domain-containing protein, partial [Byssovorax sp.]
ASFLGSPAMNFVEATLARRGDAIVADLDDGVAIPIAAARFVELPVGARVDVGVRAHDVRLEGGGAPLDVALVEALGAESFAHGTLGAAPFVARVAASAPVKKGDRIELAFDDVHLFDRSTGRSLRAP